MKEYYILIYNKVGDPIIYEDPNYQIEKLLSLDVALECLNDSYNYRDKNKSYTDFLIITNNFDLILKYKRAIEIYDLKLLIDSHKIASSSSVIGRGYGTFEGVIDFNDAFFKLYENEEIISANMTWDHYNYYPWDDNGPAVRGKDFKEWTFNKSFMYFKTPDRYKMLNEFSDVFHLPDIKKTNIEKLGNRFNANLLEFGNPDFPMIQWDESKDFLKYYDNISKMRLYIKPKHLILLKKEPFLCIRVETKLDKNQYVEYFITDLFPAENNKDYPSRKFLNQLGFDYDDGNLI
jgi:hypothetical protein